MRFHCSIAACLAVASACASPRTAREEAGATPTSTSFGGAYRGGAPSAAGIAPRYAAILEGRGVRLEAGDEVELRVLLDLGAHFVAPDPVVVPGSWRFTSAEETEALQEPLLASVGPGELGLQSVAARALAEARVEMAARGKSITLRAPDAARRSFDDTVRLWSSRVRPALDHWIAAGRLSRQDAERLLRMSPADQVLEVFRLEARGLYFSQGFDKPITYSVAPPGTSQHLSLLALDVREHGDAAVRAALARHGWHQTVYSDLPHFTFLGAPEAGLPDLGLRKREGFGRVFWVVDGGRARGPATEIVPQEECAF